MEAETFLSGQKSQEPLHIPINFEHPLWIIFHLLLILMKNSYSLVHLLFSPKQIVTSDFIFSTKATWVRIDYTIGHLSVDFFSRISNPYCFRKKNKIACYNFFGVRDLLGINALEYCKNVCIYDWLTHIDNRACTSSAPLRKSCAAVTRDCSTIYNPFVILINLVTILLLYQLETLNWDFVS